MGEEWVVWDVSVRRIRADWEARIKAQVWWSTEKVISVSNMLLKRSHWNFIQHKIDNNPTPRLNWEAWSTLARREENKTKQREQQKEILYTRVTRSIPKCSKLFVVPCTNFTDTFMNIRSPFSHYVVLGIALKHISWTIYNKQIISRV